MGCICRSDSIIQTAQGAREINRVGKEANIRFFCIKLTN